MIVQGRVDPIDFATLLRYLKGRHIGKLTKSEVTWLAFRLASEALGIERPASEAEAIEEISKLGITLTVGKRGLKSVINTDAHQQHQLDAITKAIEDGDEGMLDKLTK